MKKPYITEHNPVNNFPVELQDGTAQAPQRVRPPTKRELDFIDLCRNPDRRGEFRRWTRECLERWRAEHTEALAHAKPKATRSKKPAAPAKYTKKWSGIDE
jgi:hypothetical protein